MTPSRPYLLRALREWILDNGHTPYVLVDATMAGAQVPQGFVVDGRIVLNVSDTAAHGLSMGNSELRFDARFQGESHTVVAPVAAVLAIYSKETGRGMIFDPEDDLDPPGEDAAATGQGDQEAGAAKRPHLRIVK